ncbi:SHOCT domain-containing protein [Intrasporangium sp.]|jgi:hypothetical protein|uniref:SHOCT domain-containing protein n=1 Tax=Intrasporangium sp. TaxID=1925024 RepID=UPI003365A070
MFDNNGSFLLAMFEFFIFVAWIMCLFYVFSDIFRDRDLGGGAKTLWCIFIIVLPFLGVFVYLIARGSGMTRRSMEARQQLMDQQAEYVRSVVGSSGGDASIDQIASAKKLLDDGAITQTEFEHLKARALGTTSVSEGAGA